MVAALALVALALAAVVYRVGVEAAGGVAPRAADEITVLAFNNQNGYDTDGMLPLPLALPIPDTR